MVIIFIPSSKNKKKLETFIQQIENKKIFNITFINLALNLILQRLKTLKLKKILGLICHLNITNNIIKYNIKNIINLLLNNFIRLLAFLDNSWWNRYHWRRWDK